MGFKDSKRKLTNYQPNIDPDEVFLDSSNLPGFDTHQFEGRIEKPISIKNYWFVIASFLVVVSVFLFKAWSVQIVSGEEYAERSANNRLGYEIIFSDRGIIYDKNHTPLAWNEKGEEDFAIRKYIDTPGFSNLLGYVSYPKKDSAGFYYDQYVKGVDGLEESFDHLLQKDNGQRIIEVNALNEVVSENVTRKPESGDNLYLTIDVAIQEKLYESIKGIVDDVGFAGGGGVMMDIHSGDLLALVTYPEYDSEILSNSDDNDLINQFINDPNKPFLNRVTEGLFTPGSIIKPYMALAALQEGVIGPKDVIISEGSIVVPNPYDPSNPSIFNDWKAHGPVTVKEALAYSSNVYFYVVGGGFKDIEGLGITRIEQYLRKFGFGQDVTGEVFSGVAGTIPNPDWKREIFNDDWRVGDTYFTAIGQYGFQVTPLQVVRGVAAIATGGLLVEPRIVADSSQPPKIEKIEGIDSWVWKSVQEGMREVVLTGTAKGLNYPDIEIAGKTGTAELGVSKEKVNSWLVSFFPYENPKYALVILLEKGRRENLIGGVAVGRNFFDWLKVEHPDYFE